MSSILTSHGFSNEIPFSRPTSSSIQNDKYSYDQHSFDKSKSWFTGGLPTPPGTKAMTGVTVGNGITNYPSGQHYQNRHSVQDASNSSTTHSSSSQYSQSYSQSNRATQPSGYAKGPAEKNNSHAIASHLQIPESVNKSKGSLAEFAAEITCLFWFESAATIQYAEDLPLDAFVDQGLVPDAIPSIGFRKWVTTILSTTQVGKNVILLALMFIYRLKKFNPTVSGKRGSEFRLLTIALMLGNKFLDDNTYTNKTWAEVSGISVTEIHIMEVEFLSNMRYDLYASESEWKEWKAKLGRFGAFYEKASALPIVDETRTTAPVTPTNQSFPSKLPSPPSTHHSSSYLPPGQMHNIHHTLPNPMSTVPVLPRSPLRHQRVPSIDRYEHRKRSLDLGVEYPPAKKMHYAAPNSNLGGILTPASYTSSTSGSASVPPMHIPEISDTHLSGDLTRLPINRVVMPSVNTTNQLAPLSLSTNRAMSSVYPTTSAAWQQPITPLSAIPSNLYHNPIPALGDGSRPHSALPSASTSPNGYSITTPTVLPGLSPSYFLTNRSSPYRPVRHVNTLLIPPPSAALQNSVRNLSHDQMHYQPLSKVTTDRRTGPVPFLHPDGWHHSNVSTPVAQQYHYRA